MKMYSNALLCVLPVATLFIAAAAGCAQQEADGTPAANVQESAAFDSAKYILAEEPEGAVGVTAARKDARDGDEIVLLGRIGGSKKPWIEGRSAFMVIDASMMVVGDGEESSGGEVCLDDCCASLRADCTTLVKLVDEKGRVLPVDARQLLKADVDDLVVIHGHVERDEKEGTFVVIADGLHVRR